MRGVGVEEDFFHVLIIMFFCYYCSLKIFMTFNSKLNVRSGVRAVGEIFCDQRLVLGTDSKIHRALKDPKVDAAELEDIWFGIYRSSLRRREMTRPDVNIERLKVIFQHPPLLEAVMNSIEHGGFLEVIFRLRAGVNGVLTIIDDKGAGFDFEGLELHGPPSRFRLGSLPGGGVGPRGCGLNVMHDRDYIEVWFQRLSKVFRTILLVRENLILATNKHRC